MRDVSSSDRFGALWSVIGGRECVPTYLSTEEGEATMGRDQSVLLSRTARRFESEKAPTVDIPAAAL
jgi:hypothetical protein